MYSKCLSQTYAHQKIHQSRIPVYRRGRPPKHTPSMRRPGQRKRSGLLLVMQEFSAALLRPGGYLLTPLTIPEQSDVCLVHPKEPQTFTILESLPYKCAVSIYKRKTHILKYYLQRCTKSDHSCSITSFFPFM